jgi:hypothetical protein
METIQANTGFVWFLSVMESDNGDQEVAFIIHGTLLSESAPRQQPVSISCVHTLRRRRRAEWANFGGAARGEYQRPTVGKVSGDAMEVDCGGAGHLPRQGSVGSSTSPAVVGVSSVALWRRLCEGVATFVVESHLLGDVQAVND